MEWNITRVTSMVGGDCLQEWVSLLTNIGGLQIFISIFYSKIILMFLKIKK